MRTPADEGIAAARREAIPDSKNSEFALQGIDSSILAAAAKGEIDLNALARQELANRGLNWNLRWVGFDRAAQIANAFPVTANNGQIVAVTVPE